jgi:hypothetical protein
MEQEQNTNTTKRKITGGDVVLAIGLGCAQYLYIGFLVIALFMIVIGVLGTALALNEWFPRLITSMAVLSWVHPILGLFFWPYLFSGKIFGKIKNRRAIYFIFFFLSPIFLAILLSPITPEFSCC